jgi:cadmium resistance transport/sequestration family protein
LSLQDVFGDIRNASILDCDRDFTTTMQELVQAILTGITAFTATNLDDLVVLMLFFARTDERFRPQQIIAGQYCGFLVLVLASLPGFLGGYVVPKPWLGLLGVLPIAIGLSELRSPDDDEVSVQTISDESIEARSPFRFDFTRFLQPQIYQVAAVTVANGGDNIGIYVPLFANSSLTSLGIILVVFSIAIGIWCMLAYALARHPAIARTLTHYGHRVVPFVLIGLGIYILLESQL